MNMSVVGRQFELTDAIKAHIESAVESLKKYNLDIISTRVVISADEKNGKKGYTAEFTINLPQKNTVVIKQKDKDVYAAIDLAVERAQKVLRRHHDKMTDHRVKQPTDIANVRMEEIANADIREEDVDEIVPMELDLYKPMEIGEALQLLKDSNKQFLIFIDKDDKTRVLFKRKDNKFGLY